MGAYTGIQHCFKKSLIDIAVSLDYNNDNILILEGNEQALKHYYPQTYNNLLSCKHHADKRTPLQYGQDLVASWIFEDLFIKALKRSITFTVDLDGADKNRTILANTHTSSSSDYILHDRQGHSRKLELMTDYTGYWAKTGKLHLRDSKYKSLEQSKSLFLAVSTVTKSFAIYDFDTPVIASFIKAHRPYGNKPAYELLIANDMMIPYTSKNLISTIEAYIL